MENPQIIQMIEDLKGRKNYEENKASKLGFSSLYAYFEDRILKEENRVQKITVSVSKICPPINGDVESVSVKLSKKRENKI